MTKNIFRAGILALVVWALAPGAARACECMSGVSVCKAFANAPSVFAGRASKVEIGSNGGRTVTFEVLQAYHGVTERIIELTTGSGGGDCGYDFKEGANYLVYAYNGAPPLGEVGKLYTSVCSRTRPLAEAKDDLDYLSKKDDPARSSGIVGDITMQYRDSQNKLQPSSSAAGISVVISGVAVRKTVTTRKDGHFEIWGLEPGSYRVSPIFPDGFLKIARTVKIDAQSCEEVQFLAVPPPKKAP
ncbi:MAG TPA: hypothetical protein VLV89_00870 [Candidatus Acidoferrum sp.]|nr:hypothetical protein [Candidatus Acidoferrum sp.]